LKFFSLFLSLKLLSSRKSRTCLEHFAIGLFSALFAGALPVFGQAATQPMKANHPAPDEMAFHYLHADANGSMHYLHKNASIETSDFVISADEIQYNDDTHWAYAQGHVRLDHFNTGDKINADHAEYNIKTQSGKFYLVDGTAPAKIVASPSVLTTTNPFYFQAQWAERIKERYILHHGFLTDCTVKKPWWTFEAPVFDVIPGDRAIARNTIFRLKRVPICLTSTGHLARTLARAVFLRPMSATAAFTALL
jgi:LPS-assembly protein